jgi:hypothetical protein
MTIDGQPFRWRAGAHSTRPFTLLRRARRWALPGGVDEQCGLPRQFSLPLAGSTGIMIVVLSPSGTGDTPAADAFSHAPDRR